MSPRTDWPVVPIQGNYIRALLSHQTQSHGFRDHVDHSPQIGEAPTEVIAPGLMRSYLETYLKVRFAWCPILELDESSVTLDSPLLDHALACSMSGLVGSVLPGLTTAAEHYKRARTLFNDGDHTGQVLPLINAAIILSQYGARRSSSPTDSRSWWLGAAVRLAQDMRLHRVSCDVFSADELPMQRRIWWTLFAQERVLALCQGRPAATIEDDCNVALPNERDFAPQARREGRLFVHWVGICRIMGVVNNHMANARRTGVRIPTQKIAESITSWLRPVADEFPLPIHRGHTAPFSCDVHMLYLHYLATIALLYLNASGQDVPEISVAAIVASGCIARIAGDILHRNLVYMLSEDSAWFFTIAVSALMHVQHFPPISKYAAEDIRLLRTALRALSTTWASASTLAKGIERILIQPGDSSPSVLEEGHVGKDTAQSAPRFQAANVQSIQDLFTADGVRWVEFFPFATCESSSLIDCLLTECQDTDWMASWPAIELGAQFDSFWAEIINGNAA